MGGERGRGGGGGGGGGGRVREYCDCAREEVSGFFFVVVGRVVFERPNMVKKKFCSGERKKRDTGERRRGSKSKRLINRILFSCEMITIEKGMGGERRRGEKGGIRGRGIEMEADREEMGVFFCPFSLGFEDLRGKNIKK